MQPHRHQHTAVLVCAGVLALVLAGCTATAPGTTPTPEGSEALFTGAPRTIASELDVPWSVVFVDDTALVSERDSGRILELGTDGSAREAGIVAGVTATAGGEGGLLGLAVDGRDLYAYSTGADGNRVERYSLVGSPGSYSLGSPTPVLEGLPSGTYHNGGRIAFGPDDMLYVAIGDTQEASTAQDLDVLSGKILRITPDGEVPPDNPFPGSPVYSYGHRNVQGLAWTDDGRMFATEFGEDTWDELNVIDPGSNYGWPDVEGAGGTGDLVDPVQQWSTQEASPSGLAAAGDNLFIANLRGEVLRSVPVEDPTTSTEHFSEEYGRLRAVTLAPDGALWFVTNNTDLRGSPAPGDDRIVAVDLAP